MYPLPSNNNTPTHLYTLIIYNYIYIEIYKNIMIKKYTREDIIAYRHSLKRRGIRTYKISSLVRSVCGIGCIGVGLATSFIPFTSIPLYIVGGGLLGYDILSIYYSIKKVVIYEVRLFVLSATARLERRLREWVR